MNNLTLPDDTSTEAGVRDLISILGVGEQAKSALHERLADIITLARARRDQHAGYQALLKADVWTRVLSDTMFARWGGYLDRFDFDADNGKTVTLYCTDSSQAGDDHHVYQVPLAWTWTSRAEVAAALDAQIDTLIAKHHEARAAARLQAEANERAQLAALLAKHGAPKT